MRINVLGGGPAGLYLAIQMKLRDRSHDIRVLERNPRGSTFGWGVVFSDGTLGNLQDADPHSYGAITHAFVHWDDIDCHFDGRVIRSGGHGFCGISRQKLLDILTDRAEGLGVEVEFEVEGSVESLRDADLVVAADGINSAVRSTYADVFKPDIDVRACKFVWLGTQKAFDAFTFYFEHSDNGWYQAHCYQFDREWSTFIVETHEDTWRADGIEDMSKEEGIAFCEALFADHLGGHRLVSNADHLRGSAAWLNFPRVSCERWHHENVVLLGDAAATAHFSVGSGTKLAMESAISLARHLSEEGDLPKALSQYEDERRIEVLRLQSAARNSTEWFEQVALKTRLEPEELNYSLITRSQRVSHENLRLRDAGYLEGYEKWWARRETGVAPEKAPPPMFVPLAVGSLELKNRVACSPMAMYSAVDGLPNDFHLVHLGARALGGAGLVFSEMTCVSPSGRITPGCAGMYTDDHMQAWKRIVSFVHDHTTAKIAMQLGHSGRKGSTTLPWESPADADIPVSAGGWDTVGPSPLPWDAHHRAPREMTEDDMAVIRDEFVAAAGRATEAGFDMLELHGAHGYLLSSFISPVTNQRADAYGGTLEKRMRYPLEVLDAVRGVWPEDRPVSVRISASDWVPGGITVDDAVRIAAMFREHGADLIDVSAGQVTPDQQPVYGRMFQVPFAERIRLETGMKTMAVGNIYEPDHVNSILGAGRADLCLLARPHLWDPQWTYRAAAQLGYEDVQWPDPYLSGKQQLEVLERRAREAQGPI